MIPALVEAEKSIKGVVEDKKKGLYIFGIISAILLILSFPKFSLNYLIFIALVPLFLAIQDKSPGKTFLIFYATGFLFYLGGLYWLSNVSMIGFLLLCLYLAVYFGIFGLFFSMFSFPFTIFTILLLPLTWCILEYLQSHLFTGFGWLLLGYSQYKNISFIQIADFLGVYGVSFVIMFVNLAVYRLVEKSFKEIIIAVIIVISVIWYGILKINERYEGPELKLSVIQGNIPQKLKWEPAASHSILNKYIILTRLASFGGPDLIIWPETSFPGFLIRDRELTDIIFDLAKEIKIPILIGANTIRDSECFNSAVLISKDGDILKKYDKLHLVPFGEYVPFSKRFPVLHNLILGELGEFSPGREFTIFKIPSTRYIEPIRFGVVICFEDIFPELIRQFIKRGARFMIVITNDAWYGNSGAPFQHAASSVFRAIENRVPVVRCANTGYSCFIDSRGRIYDAVEKDHKVLFITGEKTSIIKIKQ